MNRKPSKIIQDFVELCELSHEEYLNSKSLVESYDKDTIAWVHKIENEEKAEERSKISTAWHRERKERRKHKDNMILYEKIHEFSCNEMNKSTLKRLKTILQKQIETEQYIESEDKILKSRKVIEK